MGRCNDWDSRRHLQNHTKRMGTAHVRVRDVDAFVFYPIDDPANVSGLSHHVAVDKSGPFNADLLKPAILAAQDRYFMSA